MNNIINIFTDFMFDMYSIKLQKNTLYFKIEKLILSYMYKNNLNLNELKYNDINFKNVIII